MKSVDPVAARDVFLLSFAAGSADAAGFMGLGHVFTSNMTGNLVLLGIAVGQGHIADAARSLYVLIIFMLGVALGVQLGLHVLETNWRGLAGKLIGREKILLLFFAIGWILRDPNNEYLNCVLLAALAVAMGLQSAALNRLGAPGIGTTAITGTITALITGLVIRVADPDHASSRQRLAFQAGVLGIYGIGAALCGLTLITIHWLAGLLPIAAALFVWHRRPRQMQ